MNRAGAKSNKPSKFGPMLTGVILGVLLGLIMAGVVAWYALTKNPHAFVSDEQAAKVKPAVELKSKEAATDKTNLPEKSKTAEADAKPQYEFYKVLTEAKPDSSSNADSTETVVTAKDTGLLQAGAFQKQEDAEKLKAKLAMLGIEAAIQSANVPDKGLLFRVRLGPFANANELNKVAATLKQNGMSATPVRAQ